MAGDDAAVHRPQWLRAARRVRVAVVSDTHGEIDSRVLEVVARCDAVVHAGDVGAARVLDALGSAARLVVAVRGNNDTPGRWHGDGARLAALPRRALLELPGGRLIVEHGDRAGPPAIRHSRLRATHPEARVVVYGHSHRRCIDAAAAPWILNPGAAGRARTFGGPSLLVLRAAASAWRVDEYRFDPSARRPAARGPRAGGSQ